MRGGCRYAGRRTAGASSETHGSCAPPPPVLLEQREANEHQGKLEACKEDGPVDGIPKAWREEGAETDDDRLEDGPAKEGPLDRRGLAGILELELVRALGGGAIIGLGELLFLERVDGLDLGGGHC